MSALEEDYMNYLKDSGVLPRLLDILKQLSDNDPMPVDPLTFLLNKLGCPLKTQPQMKTLERKVSRALDELRYLRRLLIDLGGGDQVYDSDTDEEEFVGAVESAESYDGYINVSPTFRRAETIVFNRGIDTDKPCCSSSLMGNQH
ncbi:uncharacterized protein [Drosophila tropicalis]|uniref:uncharacterized protein n=1 Tax=Drosophila tropicalis TaxID=46794 RepID=UPI0035AB90C6